MKSTISWILPIVFGLILLFLLPSLWMMGRFWMGGYGGMMGSTGMMGGGYSFAQPFGWGGMLLGWLIPMGVIVLVVVGAVALVNSLNRSGNPTSRTCLNCGKPTQSDWNTCPYCGQMLS